MRIARAITIIICLLCAQPVCAKKLHARTKSKRPTQHKVATAPIATLDDIVDYDSYPRNVKKLIADAMSLSDQHLSYQFGSTDPKNSGMDCSGTISYLLKQAQISDVPRQADTIYQWAYEKGEFSAVNSHRFGTFEFSKLKPGDLLFWSGTYPVKRDPAITHVMLYLGKDKHNHQLMFGANSGGTFQGKSQNGVSVFDFNLPSAGSKVKFLGYACIPHLTCES